MPSVVEVSEALAEVPSSHEPPPPPPPHETDCKIGAFTKQ